MATRKKSVPITVDAMQCLSLLTNVARAASTDQTMPSINGVLLHGDVHDDKPVLVATATDRFVMVQGNIDATGEPLPEVFVSLAEVKRVAAVLKALPKETTLLEVGAPGQGVATFSARGASATVEPIPATKDWHGWPDLAHLFALPKDLPEDVDVSKAALQGFHLARLAALAKAVGEPMRVQMFGPNRPVFVMIGERYRTLVMPMRGQDGVKSASVFLPPSELKRAEKKAAAKAEAEEIAAKAAALGIEKAPAKKPPARKPAARRTPAAKAAPRRTPRAKTAA